MEKIVPLPQSNWYAVYIKSRAEKKTQQELQGKNIETFLPLQRKLRQWSDRKKWIEMPLIPGYIFVRISRFEYDKVLQSNYITNFVRFEGTAAIIPQDQIEYLKLMLKQNLHEIEISQGILEPGQIVDVIAGTLTGLQGKLIRINNRNKVAVELEHLGYNVLVEISADDLRIA